MKMRIMLFFLIVMSLGHLGRAGAQDRFTGQQPFEVDVASFPGDSVQKNMTNVYVWVRNSHLQFIKLDTIYTARYQINLEIYRDKNVPLLTRDTTTTLTEKHFSRTIDPSRQHCHHFMVKLPPEDYLFRIRLLDLNSNSSRIQEVKDKLDGYNPAKLQLSDFLIISKSDSENRVERKVIPSLRIPIKDNIFLFAEISAPENIGDFSINVSLTSGGSTKNLPSSQNIKRTSAITPVFIHLPKADISRGEAELKLQAKAGTQSVEKKRMVRFIDVSKKWSGLMTGDEVDPMIYITEKDEWNKIHGAQGEERERLLKDFWDRRDPSEGTDANELFKEFYSRVDFANRTFGHSKMPGWRTDQGHVYIIYGAPDNIERTSTSSFNESVYETWYYSDVQKKFIFLDEFGFGEFRLISGTI